jgi:predicted flap endonuclease-1-like 5' DNA nuclease
MANYKIDDIEGIGPAYAEKLRSAGVRGVNTLLKKGADRTGRKNLAETTGLDESLILKWVNMADLYRIKGVGSEYSELLEKAGVDTVKELRNRNAENLHAKMEEVNSSGRPIVRQLPSLKMTQSWVTEANSLDPKVSY